MENMEAMEQSQTYDYDEKDYKPVEEENGQAPDSDQSDQPENEKTFTQDEVNQIVQKRLDRERQKNELRNNPDEYIKSLEEREEQVLKRELRAKAEIMRLAEIESKRGQVLPVEALDYLDYSSEDAMKESFEKFQENIIRPINLEIWRDKLRGSAPKTGTRYKGDAIKNAFKPEK